MTPEVAIDRLLCAPPCVGTVFCVYRLACGPLNNMTPAVATGRLLCAPPCVGTAFCVHHLACGPLNNMTPAVAIDHQNQKSKHTLRVTMMLLRPLHSRGSPMGEGG